MLRAERKGHYLGKTVQVVPHVTNRVIQWIEDVAQQRVKGRRPDVMLIEVGGTVGDIESMAYYEAIRQMIHSNPKNYCLVFLTYVPNVSASGEQKTKIAQQGIKELRHVGLIPDLIVCRTSQPITQSSKEKIALFGSLPVEHVFGAEDVGHLLEVVNVLEHQGISKIIQQKLQLSEAQPSLDWINNYLEISKKLKKEKAVKIAIIGKYTEFQDAYTSLIKALEFAAIEAEVNAKLEWIDSEQLEHAQTFAAAREAILACQGILIPGGFGYRGTEGKIKAAELARTERIPFFGICLGFQMAAIEYARNVMGIADAGSEEFNSDKKGENVVVFMPESSLTELGGTMRLGTKHTKV